MILPPDGGVVKSPVSGGAGRRAPLGGAGAPSAKARLTGAQIPRSLATMRLQRAIELIQRQPAWLIMALCLASLVVVGLLDYVEPDAAVATVFYLFPLSVATWCLSRTAGLGLAIAGAAMYLACGSLEARAPDTTVLLFNTLVEGAVFVIVVLLLTSLKKTLEMAQRARTVAEEALATVRQLTALLPMCSYCKRIRHEPDGSWEPFDVYLLNHSNTQVSHGLCDDCMATHYPGRSTTSQEKSV